MIYSRLSRHITARGSSTSLVTVGPTKVKACKYIKFAEGIPEVEIKNNCLMKLSHFILSHFAWLLYAVANYRRFPISSRRSLMLGPQMSRIFVELGGGVGDALV